MWWWGLFVLLLWIGRGEAERIEWLIIKIPRTTSHSKLVPPSPLFGLSSNSTRKQAEEFLSDVFKSTNSKKKKPDGL